MFDLFKYIVDNSDKVFGAIIVIGFGVYIVKTMLEKD